ncbi:MAG: hypothetical protein WAM73_06020 [Desulfobacterales bacterium]
MMNDEKPNSDHEKAPYWRTRLENCRKALVARDFEVLLADSLEQALGIVLINDDLGF